MDIMGIPINSLEIIGIVGAVIFLSSYWLVSRGKVEGKGLIYNLMLFSSSVFYLIYAYVKKAPAVIFLNAFVMIIAIGGLRNYYKRYKAKKSVRKKSVKHKLLSE